MRHTLARSRRDIGLALAVVALGTLVVACQDEDLAQPGAGRLTPVTLMLNWTPNNHHAGIYIAQEQGWYREAGIDLTIVEPSQAGADAVVATGGADFGISQ